MVAVGQPRAVVGGENDECVFVELMPAQRVEDLAHAPVDFHHHVTKQPGFALALEFFRNIKRHMHHGVGQVHEERIVLVLLNELHSALGVLRG